MEELQSFLDKEVNDPVTAAKIADHLDECGGCGMKADALRDLKESLRKLEPSCDPGALSRIAEYARELRENP